MVTGYHIDPESNIRCLFRGLIYQQLFDFCHYNKLNNFIGFDQKHNKIMNKSLKTIICLQYIVNFFLQTTSRLYPGYEL